jgi:class 3 adenylate cyclase
MLEPETRYARNGDVHLAYQVTGEGPLDLLYVPSWVNQVEHMWDHPRVAAMLEGLAAFSRLIMFDRRGTGMSDPLGSDVTLEEQMDDVAAVLDAAGSRSTALMAQLEAAAMAMLFAATRPDRARALVLYAPVVRSTAAPGYDWPPTAEQRAINVQAFVEGWGDGRRLDALAPTAAGDPTFRRWFAKLERLATSPGEALRQQELVGRVDVRDVLPSIQAPTLVLRREHDPLFDVRHSRYVAEHIPGARFVELPGVDNLITAGDTGATLAEIEEFLTGARRAPETDRILATVLFTDIVDSTGHAARLGDEGWRRLLARHDEAVRDEVERGRGRAVKSLGDGWLATFDGPARGIRAALAVRDRLRRLGLEVRAGLHTGECDVVGDDVGGMAVHIGARVGALAGPGEVLVSGTVRDLVVGSELHFADRGEHELRGVPGPWRLYAVA